MGTVTGAVPVLFGLLGCAEGQIQLGRTQKPMGAVEVNLGRSDRDWGRDTAMLFAEKPSPLMIIAMMSAWVVPRFVEGTAVDLFS